MPAGRTLLPNADAGNMPLKRLEAEMKCSHRSSVVAFFFLSHEVIATLQSCRRPTARKEKNHLILYFFKACCFLSSLVLSAWNVSFGRGLRCAGWASKAWAAPWQLADLSCDRAVGTLCIHGQQVVQKLWNHCPALTPHPPSPGQTLTAECCP